VNDETRLWNLLHDGDIVAIVRGQGGSVTIGVEVEFLDDPTAEGAGTVMVDLEECSEVVFVDGDSYEQVTDPAAIVARHPDILSARERDGLIVILCSEGELRLRYSSSSLRVAGSSPLTVESLESTSMRYWEEWERQSEEQ